MNGVDFRSMLISAPIRRLPFLLMLLIPGFTGGTAYGAEIATPAAGNGAFGPDFRASLTEESVPGGAFVLVGNGRILEIGTFGSTRAAGGRRVTADTVFRLASVSKSFSGTLAAMLAADGAFGWQDPVALHAPFFRPASRPMAITVEDILAHRTGYIPNAYDNLIEAGLERDRIHARLGELAPICTPGTCYTYQNTAFSLIEPVLERATGVAYPELMRTRIFEPLQMRNATVGYQDFMAATNRAEPHVRMRQSWRAGRVDPDYYQVGSAAGVNASIRDMAQWLLAALGHYPDVVGPDLLDQVMQPRVRTTRDLHRRYWRGVLEDAHYGLGWRIYRIGGRELIYHGGWVSGYRAEISLSREMDLGLAILINAESGVVTELTRAFWLDAFARAPTGHAAAGPVRSR